MQHSSKPALDKKRMLEWAVFNVAVGNMDSHAKNLSLLATGGRHSTGALLRPGLHDRL